MGDQIELKPKIISEDEKNQIVLDKNVEVVDIYDDQVVDLKKINNPANPDQATITCNPVYLYYVQQNKILRCVDETSLFKIRTNRNKNLLSDDDQEILNSKIIGVSGMSVVAGIAIGAVYSGISNIIKIADHDTLDTSNLNRLRESLLDVGKPKTHLASRNIYNINPFGDVYNFDDGINESNIDDFFNNPKLDIIVDEIDDFKIKVMMRVKAKECKIPLLMFTSLGDNILVDVERYDINPDQIMFNGLLHDDGREILENPNIDVSAIRRYSIEVVGQEYIPTKALSSVIQMGRTLVGRPQLYSTIAIDGGLASFTIRRILLKGDIKSGRYYLRLTDLYSLEDNDLQLTSERQEILNKMFN